MSEPALPTLCPLPDLGLIEVTGGDAAAFLNAQLSRNVHSGSPLRAPLAAWHDAKGRVLAVLRVLWTGESWLLLAKGADAQALIRRLSMFVLRADVGLRDASPDWRAAAALGDIDSWVAGHAGILGARAGDAAALNGTFVIRAGPRFAYLAAPREPRQAAANDLPAGSGESVAVEELRLGLVDLLPQLAGRFTPQTLNLDRMGALAFDKGCYPGQEVIARIHHLGRVKRRVFRFSAELTQRPAVGSALLDSGGGRVGEMVRAASTAEKKVELLAVVPVDAASGPLACAAAVGVPLIREPLPGE